MTKVLVACADYPSDESRALQYVHVRNKYYQKHGIDVTVLNFASQKSYVYENIEVISLEDFYNKKESFKDCVLICHAPNLRNHYRFIKKNSGFFGKKLFFFHGHEIVKLNKAYPQPYPFMQENLWKKELRNLYDCFKLRIWRYYFLKEDTQSPLIFVSNSLKNDFLKFLRISEIDIADRTHIIHNSVGKVFEQESYTPKIDNKMYDFITIRSNLDSSVYCIDLVTEIAYKNPDKSFLIIGKGKYYEYNKKPDNITLINRSMTQEELIQYINSSKVALMPTRRDSQGVMTCELATFGIPVITSDLAVCREMFDGFSNVYMVNNSEISHLIEKCDDRFAFKLSNKNGAFLAGETLAKECKLI